MKASDTKPTHLYHLYNLVLNNIRLRHRSYSLVYKYVIAFKKYISFI